MIDLNELRLASFSVYEEWEKDDLLRKVLENEDYVIRSDFGPMLFLASSSAVLNEDTAMRQDLCTKRKIKRDFYVTV